MKTWSKTAVRFIRQNSVILIIFFFMLFRPQIMFWLRNEVINPLQKRFFHIEKSAKKCEYPRNSAPVIHAGFIRTAEEDDGCGDDGSCSEDDESEDNTKEDYSEDEGCNDDGSCETEDDSYYADEESSYEDDGCSCSGETVVTSTGSDNSYYFNSTLQIILHIRSTGSYKMFISDCGGTNRFTIFRNTSYGNGDYYFSWNGYDTNDQLVNEGYYKVIFESESSPYVRREQNFYYSSANGFQVNGTSGYIVELFQ